MLTNNLNIKNALILCNKDLYPKINFLFEILFTVLSTLKKIKYYKFIMVIEKLVNKQITVSRENTKERRVADFCRKSAFFA